MRHPVLRSLQDVITRDNRPIPDHLTTLAKGLGVIDLSTPEESVDTIVSRVKGRAFIDKERVVHRTAA